VNNQTYSQRSLDIVLESYKTSGYFLVYKHSIIISHQRMANHYQQITAFNRYCFMVVSWSTSLCFDTFCSATGQ